MIRTKCIFFADSVAIDRLSNRLSVFHIYEQLRATAFPVFLPSFVLVALLERELSDSDAPQATLRIKLDDDVLFEQRLEVNFGNERLTRAVSHFQGMVIPRQGDIRAELQVGEDLFQSYVFIVFPPVGPAVLAATAEEMGARIVQHAPFNRPSPGAT